ncbi:uncharacterized protein LOC106640827 [Copidosoma floridanum]|uniref:uncharacterized protein LOC106640827 n=1 Tax=Copidosoma floridanum TaxID=29053 RepID=UPI0006C9416D|nr:uncharacterized protein LOC106640827 [Copidosoma floridanum]
MASCWKAQNGTKMRPRKATHLFGAQWRRPLFETHVPLKIGAFSSEEDRILKKNWKAFCKLHNWDKKNPKPFLYMRPHNKFLLRCRKNRLRFVQFLADGLHDRSLYSVYHRFRILYEPHKTSRYAQEEDNVILNFIKNHDTNESSDRKFADLAIMLKRTRASVWRRYRVLKKKYKIATEH